MVQLNSTILANWIIAGYKSIKFQDRGEYGIVTPRKEYLGEYGNDWYTLPFKEIEVLNFTERAIFTPIELVIV